MKKNIILIILTIILSISCSKNNDGSISGIATANEGKVVSGITVKLYSDSTTLLSDTQTDSQGNFLFTGLDSNNYYVGATVTIDGEVWDTGNTPQIIFVGGEIVEKITLTLNKK